MRKRNKSIKIRLTEQEHEALLAIADGKPLAPFMREYCLSADGEYFAKIAKRNREKINRLSVSPELLRALASLGNNINQIARSLNTQIKSGNELEIMRVAMILDEIKTELKGIRNDS